MKCSNCDGWGLVQIAPNVKGLKRCPVCNGTGEVGQIEQTNEEWFCGLSTEEKAKFLRQIYRDGRDDYVGEWYEQTEKDFEEWLKQPHKDTK